MIDMGLALIFMALWVVLVAFVLVVVNKILDHRFNKRLAKITDIQQNRASELCKGAMKEMDNLRRTMPKKMERI